MRLSFPAAKRRKRRKKIELFAVSEIHVLLSALHFTQPAFLNLADLELIKRKLLRHIRQLNKSSEIKDSEQFKLHDSSSYNYYAVDYHHCVEKLCEPFVCQMSEFASLKPGQRILDVGTGTGIVANYAARVLKGSGSIVGIDLSEGMLRTAATNADRAGLENVKFLRIDAENLGLSDQSFDSVLSMCAMMHFPDALKALREMHRVLKPEGHLVISIGCRKPPWGGGRLEAYYVGIKRGIRQIYQPHLYAPNFILSLMNRRLSHLPLPPHTGWGGKDPGKSLLKIIGESGFEISGIHWNHNMIPIQTSEEFWQSQLAIVTQVRKRFETAEQNVKESFYEEFVKLADAALARDGSLYYCASVFIINAIRR